jgi:hypothetical protein
VRSAVEAGLLQMPSNRVDGRRPGLRGAADPSPTRTLRNTAPAGQPFVRSCPCSTAVRRPGE